MDLLNFLIEIHHYLFLILNIENAFLFLACIFIEERSIIYAELPEILDVLHWVILNANKSRMVLHYVSLYTAHSNNFINLYIFHFLLRL
jgi:hypothetical protein